MIFFSHTTLSRHELCSYALKYLVHHQYNEGWGLVLNVLHPK